jgi:hypothetical protein
MQKSNFVAVSFYQESNGVVLQLDRVDYATTGKSVGSISFQNP